MPDSGEQRPSGPPDYKVYRSRKGLFSRLRSADLSSLRLALSGGAPIPESLLQTWLDRGLMIIEGYDG